MTNSQTVQKVGWAAGSSKPLSAGPGACTKIVLEMTVVPGTGVRKILFAKGEGGTAHGLGGGSHGPGCLPCGA